MGRRLIKALSPEIEKIKNPELRILTKQIINDCCDETCDRGASSTAKYHPMCDLGEGGLIRHIKLVCRNIETIMKMWEQYDGTDWDIPYISCILHDMCKYTEKGQEHSHQNHPLLMAEKIRKFKPISQEGWFIDYKELANYLEKIAQNVSSHMSRWNTDRDGNIIGEKPKNMENAFVAIADMMSAQKHFCAFFDKENNLIDYNNPNWMIENNS
jgi:hypothetical protein